MTLLVLRLYFVFMALSTALSGSIIKIVQEGFQMSYTVHSIGQALTQAQVTQYYNAIGTITYDELKQQTMSLYGMDSTTFDCWMGWIVNEGYAHTNGSWEGYLTQCTATNIYMVYSDHTAAGFCASLGGYDPSYTVSAMQSAGLLAYYNQTTYQPELKCAFLAMANPDQRCFACNGVDHYPTIIASWFDGSNMIYVFQDPNGVRTYPYVQNGGVFGGSGSISFTERMSSPEGEYNPCYMTTGYIQDGIRYLGTFDSTHWNTCILGDPIVTGANVLANCTGYCEGRSLEVYCEGTGYDPVSTGTQPWLIFSGHSALEWYDTAAQSGIFSVNPTTPAAGAVMVWGPDWAPSSAAGHVAFVEKVIDNNTIIATESGYGGIAGGRNWIRHNRYRGADGLWSGDLFNMGGYSWLGFIYNLGGFTPVPPVPPTPTGSKSSMIYLPNHNNRMFRRLY